VSVHGDFPACVGCGFIVDDVAASSDDGAPRCRPCERRADHKRRLERGDWWYRDRIAEFAVATYGHGWEREPGFAYCAGVFAHTRALCGWAGVGVELPPPRQKPIRTRPCPHCGEVTASASGYFCAGCHFAGWWGRWA
jgi:hypothetical protein